MKGKGRRQKASTFAKATADKAKGIRIGRRHKGTKFSPLPLVGEGPGVRAKKVKEIINREDK